MKSEGRGRPSLKVEGSATEEAGRVVVVVGEEAEKAGLEVRLRRVMVVAKRASRMIEMMVVFFVGVMLVDGC